jgi:predicted nucleic acid-binding protein
VGSPLSVWAIRVLVVDASVIVAACLGADGWAPFDGHDLVSPPLGLSESLSVLHEARWRGDLDPDAARAAAERLTDAPLAIRAVESPLRAWDVADKLGWAKTYDAEYIVLALMLGCELVTLDERLRRVAARLVPIIGPTEVSDQSGTSGGSVDD